MRRRKWIDRCILLMIHLTAYCSVLLLAGMLGYVFVRGLPVVSRSFLTTVPSVLHGTMGIAGNIVNTVYMIVLTLLIVVPVGVGAAVWLNEYAGRRSFVRAVEFTTETLAGIPSIVFGLFGMTFFGTALGYGYSLLTGALTLSVMVLPLVIRNTQEALREVPAGYREGALGLGAGRWCMIRTVLLPAAKPGILAGVVLAAGRILGESAALLFTAGSGHLLPKGSMSFLRKIMESGGTLAVQMYLSMSRAQYDEAFGIAAVLLCIIMLVSLIADVLAGHPGEG